MYYVEMTDVFGGEANYSWVHRFLVKASTPLGAIRKVTAHTGHPARKAWDTGDTVRYNVPGACICYFVTWLDETAEHQPQYVSGKRL